MRNPRFILAYDGTDFRGRQGQPEGTTPQALLEGATDELAGMAVQVCGSGRTDSRVDAKHRVAVFQSPSAPSGQCGFPDAGASLIELVLVLSLFGTLTALALALVLQSYQGIQLRLSTSNLFDTGTTALNQMTRELRMAGYPSANDFTSAAVAGSPGLAATPFVTVTAYDVVFQSDIQQDGTVQQIEYVLAPGSQNLYRNSTVKNSNGALAASTVQTLLLNNVKNQINGTPLFTWTTNPSDTQAFPLNVQSVDVNLVLESTSNESGSPASVTLTATCPRMNY